MTDQPLIWHFDLALLSPDGHKDSSGSSESCFALLQALESMSELVKQGIQEASKGLQQENEEKIMQEVSGKKFQSPTLGSFKVHRGPIFGPTFGLG